MKVHEKIDILMKLTNTSNSVLGKYLTFDASYISRIRSGKRKMPPRQPFAEPASCYFAAHIREPFQKKLAADLMTPGSDWPENDRVAQQLIYGWLSDPDRADSSPIGGLLSGISAMQPAALPAMTMPPVEQPSTEETRFFYGDEGKRKAVSLFLSELGQMEHPPQLLLYSNEEFNWMYDDPAFARQWAMLLFQYIRRGGRIKIAHTISRASGEMLLALQKWIPVYMTGAIEPYYYPKTLDRVFRKTLFIAEGHSAIAASSVGEHTENALNCLIREPRAVRALEQEYWDFFASCRPLMQIFNVTGRERFQEALRSFHAAGENMLTVRTTPSFYTMPEAVAGSMEARLDSSWLRRRQQLSGEAFRELMQNGNTLTEILNLPPEQEALEGRVAFPMCDLFDKPGLFYTAEELAAHLRQVIALLRQYPGYQVVLSGTVPPNELIYVKEDSGVILVKSDVPSIAFVIREQRMVSAFWDYLSEMKDTGSKKEKTIARLEAYAEKLEKDAKHQ